ncbi:sensor histidine kinase [Cyclobacterium marinum]|uniref:Putative signal transduction histidine kinase n=1 Tax=Cyclobacterium marinum (strain ATCC 25205 / DSM 745 / LMG 13164 / NCIMB 1802) TaxID=880070 RepID=G0IUZ9_CYCMS|nr:histidine kinase [Cyclobacterium marinum]AEL26223.1 putative signal transduction histidine kinase [Cyclobacterium marinum DSM 745]
MGYKNFLTGIITAAFLSLVVFFPKSQFRPGFSPGWESAVVVFIHAVLIWVVIEQVLKSKWINKLSYKVLLSVFIGVLIVFTIQRVFVDLANWELFSLDSSLPQRRVFVFTFFRGVVITLFLFFIEYLLFIIKETERLKRDAESIKQENLEAKLFALQQQINPHFLFNALNTLHSIAPDAETKKYVLNFSNVFRYQLNQNRTLLASLKDELEFTMAYLHILKERFEDGLIINIDIPSECLGRKTPPVAMQMLIENAIKHNVLSEEFPLHLKIFVKDNYLVVSNNIQHKDTMETSTGIGLHNISERYRLMSENDVIISDYSKTFTVKLPLI